MPASRWRCPRKSTLSTFDYTDLTLTLNGNDVPLDDRVTVAHESGSSYLISGLEHFTAGQGEYELKVQAAGIMDVWGNAGVGSAFDLWVTDSTPPQSAVQPLTSPATSKSFAVTVVGSDVQPADGVVVSGVSLFDVYVSVDQGAFTLWQSLPAANPTAMFTGPAGTSTASAAWRGTRRATWRASRWPPKPGRKSRIWMPRRRRWTPTRWIPTRR